MALVFISHAHSDESVVRKMVAFLRDALELEPQDFFVSSQGGRGVAPAVHIREEILKQLSTAPALIVLITPMSAGSPWVWLEAGNRFGREDRANPIFVVPSERFVSLLQPVADLRCIRLDDDDDLHEFVEAVGSSLARKPRDVLTYKSGLDELSQSAAIAYSRSGERKARALSWLRVHWAALLFLAIGIAAVLHARSLMDRAARTADDTLNTEVVRTAARYLRLKGTVLSPANTAIAGATVMASRDNEVRDIASCVEPHCTSKATTSDGEFLIDLTRIKAQDGDDIVLSVVASGFDFFSQNVRVDVRAMDVRFPPHRVTLASIRP